MSVSKAAGQSCLLPHLAATRSVHRAIIWALVCSLIVRGHVFVSIVL